MMVMVMVMMMMMVAARWRVINVAMCLAATLILCFQFKGCMTDALFHQYLADGMFDRVRIGI